MTTAGSVGSCFSRFSPRILPGTRCLEQYCVCGVSARNGRKSDPHFPTTQFLRTLRIRNIGAICRISTYISNRVEPNWLVGTSKNAFARSRWHCCCTPASWFSAFALRWAF